MALIGPFSKGYPVDFKSSGDTTRNAFGKHIQEIERIYGYLNALDAGKVSASDVSGLSGSIGNISSQLQAHIDSTNPHPNWKPSVGWSDLTGTKPNLADFGGNLDASRVSGKLSNANIDTSGVNGLKSFVEGLIPSGGGGGSGTGITSLFSTAKTGYAKFGDLLTIQWGETGTYNISGNGSIGNTEVHSENFATNFTSACYVLLDNGPVSRGLGSNGTITTTIESYDRQSYVVSVQNSATLGATSLPVKYIAIGR